jgi:LCP family protein required for cell wall assembly
MRPQRCGVKWRLSVACAALVVGGFAANWAALHDRASIAESAAVQPAVAAAPQPLLASPQPLPATPQPVREIDQAPPPFAPAVAEAPLQPTLQAASPAGRMTILLLGIDQRPDEAAAAGDPGRTDTMLLVSIDFDAHAVAIVSIPRDGFVAIPDHGNERVNAAYTLGEIDQRGGGPALAKRTIAQLFDVAVDRFALVDIHSMEQIIDTLGGVSIDNPARLVDTQYPTDDYGTISIDIPAGRQVMDGVTAVEYARTRHPDSDFGRQARQQQLLLAIRDQALRLQTLARLPRLIPEVLGLVHTDLSPLEIGQLLTFSRAANLATDVITQSPDPEWTPSYTGPGGAAYVSLSSTYRAAARATILQPRVATERARGT